MPAVSAGWWAKLTGGIGETVHRALVDVPELRAGERRPTGAGVGDGRVGEDEVVAGGALRELSPNGRSDLVGERDAADAGLAFGWPLKPLPNLPAW